MQQLLTAVSHIITTHMGHSQVQDAHLQMLVAAVGQLGSARPVPSQTWPVVDGWLETAVSQAPPFTQPLAAAIWRSREQLNWAQAYKNYAGEPDIDQFRHSYAFAVLVGTPNQYQPHVNFASKRLLLGLALQAPHTLYPTHVHKAVEFYYLVSGTAVWQQGDTWHHQPPGALLYHPSGVRHATQTSGKPLLALFAWTTDLGSESVIVRG